MNATELAGLAELVEDVDRRAVPAERSALAAGASPVYAKLLAGRERLNPDRSALELAGRLLADVAGGGEEHAPTAYRLLQETVPALRILAGMDGPSELERELRKRYGVPAPGAAVL